MVKEFMFEHKKIVIDPVVRPQEMILKGCNSLQIAHINGEINLYQPIEAYSEQWRTKWDKEGMYEDAMPIEGTRRRNDLAPVYMQWKDAARRA